MSLHAFLRLLVFGAAPLALWVIARYTASDHQTVPGAIVHVIVAMVYRSAAARRRSMPSTRAAYRRRRT